MNGAANEGKKSEGQPPCGSSIYKRRIQGPAGGTGHWHRARLTNMKVPGKKRIAGVRNRKKGGVWRKVRAPKTKVKNFEMGKEAGGRRETSPLVVKDTLTGRDASKKPRERTKKGLKRAQGRLRGG